MVRKLCVCAGGCSMLCMEEWECHCIRLGIFKAGHVRNCRYMDEQECSKGMARDPCNDAVLLVSMAGVFRM